MHTPGWWSWDTRRTVFSWRSFVILLSFIAIAILVGKLISVVVTEFLVVAVLVVALVYGIKRRDHDSSPIDPSGYGGGPNGGGSHPDIYGGDGPGGGDFGGGGDGG